MEVRDAKSLASRSDSGGRGSSITSLYPLGPAAAGLVAVDMLEIEPGGQTGLHAHGEEHVIFVFAGSGELSGSGAGAPTVKVAAFSVLHIAPHEPHSLRNTGGERLRALVTTPLLAWSDRALGIAAGGAETAPAEGLSAGPEKAESPALMREAGREAALPAPSGDGKPPAVPSAPDEEPSAVSEEAPLPDISRLMKRGSEIAAGPRPERRKPEPEPTVAPPPAEAEATEEEEEEGAQLMELNIVFDGGSRGNPGQGYGSFLVQSPGRRPVIKRLEFGNNYTNNQAEYDSLIRCLEYVIDRLTATNRSPAQVALDIKSDSDLLVNQINGQYKVKDAGLRKRHEQAMALLEQFGAWLVTWHPREESVRLLGH